jgi:hypothetical protein
LRAPGGVSPRADFKKLVEEEVYAKSGGMGLPLPLSTTGFKLDGGSPRLACDKSDLRQFAQWIVANYRWLG